MNRVLRWLQSLPEPARSLGQLASIGAAWGGCAGWLAPVSGGQELGTIAGAAAGLGIWLLQSRLTVAGDGGTT